MAKSVQKIAPSQSRDIPFNKLVLSESNVRRIKAGVLSHAQDSCRPLATTPPPRSRLTSQRRRIRGNRLRNGYGRIQMADRR